MGNYKFKHGATVGRYRPYHKGHRYLHKKMLRECERITIVIGSAQEEETYDNPFKIEEVKEMIENCFKKDLNRIRIMSVKDINDFDRWSQYILNSIGEKVDAYYAGCPEDMEAFLKEKDISLITLNREYLSNKFGFKSGTEIREMIYSRNPDCYKYVPKCNWSYLRRIFTPI